MYSMVVLMTLSGSAETPEFFFRRNNCNGGGCYGSCYGGNGCNGGRFLGGGGFLGGRRGKGCHGSSSCYGSGCYGSSCYGSSCHGSGYGGCHGSVSYGGCHGTSYHGGCHGASYHGGCHGSSYHGGCHGTSYHGGCHGASYHGGCHGSSYHGGCHGTIHHGGGVIIEEKKIEKMPKPEDKKEGTLAPAPAKVIVSLPAEATLTVDDTVTKSTGTSRALVSPALDPGKTYYYTLKASLEQEGKTETVTERVQVRAGRTTRVTLEIPTTESVAAK